jgi:CII-binding regulator of phage lambda lysogenization HflD
MQPLHCAARSTERQRPPQKTAVIGSNQIALKQGLTAVFSVIRRQSQQSVVKLAAATVNRRVVAMKPFGRL